MHRTHISIDELVSDIQKEHLTADQRSKDDGVKRKCPKYTPLRFNGVDLWLPCGVSISSNEYLSQVKNKAGKIDKLVDLFNHEKCILSRQSMQFLAGFSQHNMGGSDQATCLLFSSA